MKKPSFKKRFSYWFDGRMSRGSLGLIKLLAIATLIVILLITMIIVVFSLKDDGGFFEALWDSLSTVINAWMPASEDGGPAYLILMAIAAIAGLLVTSVLIGIITSAIEEKITSLKKGNSDVLEEGHLVVLGFYPGEYTLLRQLVLAAGEEPDCIVVAAGMDQEEMSDCIHDNIDVPKNVRIICRTIDITEPVSLQKCAVQNCRAIIISPTDDSTTTKALLAVSALTGRGETYNKVYIGAIVSEKQHLFPASMARMHHITTLQTNETLAKIIAHSCTQPGLSETFCEVFSFEGSEFYYIGLPGAAVEAPQENIEAPQAKVEVPQAKVEVPQAKVEVPQANNAAYAENAAMTFADVTCTMDGGIPVGIFRNGTTVLNPSADTVLKADDKILVFAENKSSVKLLQKQAFPQIDLAEQTSGETQNNVVSVIGMNDSIATIINELPAGVSELTFTNISAQDRDYVRQLAQERGDFAVSFFKEDLTSYDALASIAKRSDHIILLSDHTKDAEDADMEIMFLLLNLRDIRDINGSTFNITAEMQREHNQRLMVMEDNTDFVVASNLSSLILAQLAENPNLLPVFKELLSIDGNEFYLKKAGDMHCAGEMSTARIRSILLRQGCIFIGYKPAGTRDSIFNPPLTEILNINEDDRLIVIGEE